MTTSDRKIIAIRTILRQDAYTRDSGLYRKLVEDLNKLSADTLSNLAMLVDQSRVEVSRCAREQQALINQE